MPSKVQSDATLRGTRLLNLSLLLFHFGLLFLIKPHKLLCHRKLIKWRYIYKDVVYYILAACFTGQNDLLLQTCTL